MKLYYHAEYEHVRTLRLEILARDLSVPPDFRKASVDTLRRCYNGIGPEAWSGRFRAFTTRLLKRFESDALIHDWEYTFQPRTYTAFTMANLRFAWNAARNAWLDRDWFTPWKSFLAQSAAGLLLALLCQLFGWHGYKHPFRRGDLERNLHR